ncbi:unnamed protein product [Bathycoccus prasinos]
MKKATFPLRFGPSLERLRNPFERATFHHFSPRLKGGKDSDLYVAIGVVLMMFFLAFMIAWWNSNTSSRRKSKVR